MTAVSTTQGGVVTDQRAGQVASVTSPAGAPSPAEGDGRSGPQAAGVVPLPPAAPVGEPCCTCGAWYAPPEARRRCAPDCPASEGDGRSGSQAAEMRRQRDKAWHDHAATLRELEALRRQARQEIQNLEGTKARLEEELRTATAGQLQLDRIGAVRAALALLAPHQPSQGETPAGWTARARQGDPEALIYNAILSLDGALRRLTAPGEGGT